VGQVGQVGRVGQVGQVRRPRNWPLAAVVLLHLAISLVHGRAHAGAEVFLPLAGALFVYIVIVAGPLVGLAVSRWRPRAGAWIAALSFSGALIFGLVNHFIIAGPDHVAHVAAEWRTMFGATAALLVASETVGAATAVWIAVRHVRSTT
jgi:hypothetical protein